MKMSDLIKKKENLKIREGSFAHLKKSTEWTGWTLIVTTKRQVQ